MVYFDSPCLKHSCACAPKVQQTPAKTTPFRKNRNMPRLARYTWHMHYLCIMQMSNS